MSGKLRLWVTALLAVLAVLPIAAGADPVVPPSVPDAIAVPAGNKAFLVVHAMGTQTYTCTAAGTWSTASVPQADLFAQNGQLIGQHSAGPVWRMKDGSWVQGAKVAGVSPDATAIPWLLLRAVTSAAGPDGDRLLGVTYVQRVMTIGGLAPSGPCTAGGTVSVPYQADYYFYRASSDGN